MTLVAICLVILYFNAYSVGQHSKKTFKIWGLPGWVQRDLPAIDRNGESSSPDLPAGTGGTKV